MNTYIKKLVNMYAAASNFGNGTGLLFIATNEGVSCYAPLGRREDAEYFIKELQSIVVTAVNQVDWAISKANLPNSNNLDVLRLQAALDVAGLSSQVLVFANDGIKVNTNGPDFEVYEALSLLKQTTVAIHEGTFFQHF